jgi:hypothetical protein
MFKKSILLVIIVLIFAASSLWAEISAEIVEAAEQGDASAQFNLGQIYRKGMLKQPNGTERLLSRDMLKHSITLA